MKLENGAGIMLSFFKLCAVCASLGDPVANKNLDVPVRVTCVCIQDIFACVLLWMVNISDDAIARLQSTSSKELLAL